MELSLVRKFFTETYTIGKLSSEGEYLCDTLEPMVRDLHDINHDGDFTDPGEGKIIGKTAIPYGRYRIIMVWSPKHQQTVPMLLDVPGFVGVEIHAGSFPHDTEGCILPGENRVKGQVVNSRYHTAIIYEKIINSIDKGDKVYIKITM